MKAFFNRKRTHEEKNVPAVRYYVLLRNINFDFYCVQYA